MLKKKTLFCSLIMFLCGFCLYAASILEMSTELYTNGVENNKTFIKLQKRIEDINSLKDCEKLNEKDNHGFTAFQYIAMTPGTDEIFSIALDKYSDYMGGQLYGILNNPLSNLKFVDKKFIVEDYIYNKDGSELKYLKNMTKQVSNSANKLSRNASFPEKEYENYVHTTDLTLTNFNLFLYILYNEGLSEKINFLMSNTRYNSIIDYNIEGKIETNDQFYRVRPLTCAIRKGNKKLVEFLLSKNVDVNYETERSFYEPDRSAAHMRELTPLIEAILVPNYNIDIIKALLEKEANINVGYTYKSANRSFEKYSPLFIAIDQNDANLFELIYSLYSNPAAEKLKYVSSNLTIEFSPLHWAINKNVINEPIVTSLFDAATSQQIIKKEDGKTYTAAELLLDRKDISSVLRNRVKNIDGEIKIFEAIENADYEMLHTVLEDGMNANLSKNNHSAFEYAVGKAKDRNGDDVSIKIVEDLLKHGAKVNAICNGGKTMFVSLILNAVDKGLDNTTRKLIRLFNKYELDMDLPIVDNLPVLHHIVNSIGQSLDKELLIFLLEDEFNLDINQRVPGGEYNNWTPLLFAIVNGNSDIVQFLIDKGAMIDIDIKQDDSNIFTPLALAFARGKDKCASILLDNGANQTVTVSLDGVDKISMLMLACSSSDWSMVSRLLDNTDIKINNFDSKGRNAFMYAAQYNNDSNKAIKILRNLRGRKAVIDHIDNNGKNAYTLGFDNKQNGEKLLWLLEHGVPFQEKVTDIERYVDDVEYYNVLKEICEIE